MSEEFEIEVFDEVDFEGRDASSREPGPCFDL
jgi:hypothetical protein